MSFKKFIKEVYEPQQEAKERRIKFIKSLSSGE